MLIFASEQSPKFGCCNAHAPSRTTRGFIFWKSQAHLVEVDLELVDKAGAQETPEFIFSLPEKLASRTSGSPGEWDGLLACASPRMAMGSTVSKISSHVGVTGLYDGL